jgi:hypothetical protein
MMPFWFYTSVSKCRRINPATYNAPVPKGLLLSIIVKPNHQIPDIHTPVLIIIGIFKVAGISRAGSKRPPQQVVILHIHPLVPVKIPQNDLNGSFQIKGNDNGIMIGRTVSVIGIQ